MEQSRTKLVIVVLIVCTVFFGIQYFLAQRELSVTKAALTSQNVNEKTLSFTKLFIEKVLKADKEIDFETRLSLENGVRSLGDENILAQWQKFTDSKTESDAQREVKSLLQALVNNLAVK
jgi:hypothetical protein